MYNDKPFLISAGRSLLSYCTVLVQLVMHIPVKWLAKGQIISPMDFKFLSGLLLPQNI